jgi:hypothetical protein
MKPIPKQPSRWRRFWRLGGCLALASWWLAGCGSKPPPAAPPKTTAGAPPAKATNVAAANSNMFRGHFADGRATTGRDPFFPESERGRPGASSTNFVGPVPVTPSAATNWVLTSIMIDSEGREARINGVKLSEGSSKWLKYSGGTTLVECLEIAATQVVIRVEGKRIVIPWKQAKR